MKAAIALLANHEIHNHARKLAFELHRAYGIPFLASLLPAHISLKQPFSFESMPRLERYFDGLAARIGPLEIVLDHVYHVEWGGYGILGLNVQETPELRELHNRLNRELSELFVDTAAPHDGEGYHFHLTVELGQIQGQDVYKQFYEGLAGKNVELRFTAEQLALFYYGGEGAGPGSYMTYRILPLSGPARSG